MAGDLKYIRNKKTGAISRVVVYPYLGSNSNFEKATEEDFFVASGRTKAKPEPAPEPAPKPKEDIFEEIAELSGGLGDGEDNS